MAAKFKVYVYQVYRQNPPVFCGKDPMGVDQFRADLEFLSTVSGTYNECWKRAVDLCANPVMEKMSEEMANVH